MFSYYGSKSKVIDLYPSPKHSKIIEPFAGSARYALKYWERDVLLVDKYELVVRIWKWLQQCSRADILSLPILEPGQSVDNFKWDCDEAKWLVGFNISTSPQQPKKTATYWKTVLRPNTQKYKLEITANNLDKIRHWTVRQGDYIDIPNQEATWFIDAPYQYGGEHYRVRFSEFSNLSNWSRSRLGQAIVCENTKADWLPFWPLRNMQGSKYKTTEAIWCNDVMQVPMFAEMK